jgi:hypothetical protein
MTIPEFNDKWGEQWGQLKKHSMFKDLMVTIMEQSPAFKAHGVTMDNMTNHTPAFVGSIAGYSLCLDLLKSQLGEPLSSNEQDATFETPIEELFPKQPKE